MLDVSEGYILNGASSNSTNYLDKEFSELLKGCSSEKQKTYLWYSKSNCRIW